MIKKTFLKLSTLLIIILSVGLFLSQSYKTSAADSVNVTLKINTGTITYATGSSLDLGSGTAAYYIQYLSGSWGANTFRVSDTRGNKDRTRSAAIGNATDGSFVISGDNFQIKDMGAEQPVFIQGDNTCGMATQLTTSYQTFTGGAPKNFLSKTNNSKICKYGVTPNIQVTIPANQPIGDYSATVTLTSSW